MQRHHAWPDLSLIGRLALLLLPLLTASCGREPTDPARSNLNGVWKSFDAHFNLYNIELELVQPAPGLVTGIWTSQGRVDNSCPPSPLCRDTSTVIGRSEVAQVVLDLQGMGPFVGQLVQKDTLRGAIRLEGRNFHLKFGRYP